MQKDVDAAVAPLERDIHLIEYLERSGYERVARETTPSTVVLRHPPSNEELIVARSTDGRWIYAKLGRDSERIVLANREEGGTLRDFIRHRAPPTDSPSRRELSLADLHQVLEGIAARPTDLPSSTRIELIPIDANRFSVAQTVAAARYKENSLYLRQCGLDPDTQHHIKFREAWKEDSLGHVLFPSRDHIGVCGFEVANYGASMHADAKTRGLWHSLPQAHDRALVFTDTPIAAMSYHQLKSNYHRMPASQRAYDDFRTFLPYDADGRTPYLLPPSARTISPENARYASTGNKPLNAPQLELARHAIAQMPPESYVIVALSERTHDAVKEQILSQARAARRPDIAFMSEWPRDWSAALRQIQVDHVPSRTFAKSFDRSR